MNPYRTRRHLLVWGVAGAAGLAGCAAVLGPPTVTLTPDDLERLVERNFPIDRALLEIFDVTVNAPRLSLLPERNRLGAVVDVRVRNRLLLSRWQGRLSFDAELRWEPRDQTLRLSQVRVQDLALDNPAAANRSTVERLGAALAERVLEDSTLYRLNADRAARLQKEGLTPGAVTVTSRGVEISFVPAPRP